MVNSKSIIEYDLNSKERERDSALNYSRQERDSNIRNSLKEKKRAKIKLAAESRQNWYWIASQCSLYPINCASQEVFLLASPATKSSDSHFRLSSVKTTHGQLLCPQMYIYVRAGHCYLVLWLCLLSQLSPNCAALDRIGDRCSLVGSFDDGKLGYLDTGVQRGPCHPIPSPASPKPRPHLSCFCLPFWF